MMTGDNRDDLARTYNLGMPTEELKSRNCTFGRLPDRLAIGKDSEQVEQPFDGLRVEP